MGEVFYLLIGIFEINLQELTLVAKNIEVNVIFITRLLVSLR